MEDEGPPRLLKRSQQGTRSKRTRKREQIRTRPTPASYEEETLTRLDTQPRPNRGRVGPSYRKTDYSSQPQSSMLPALCPAQPWSQKRPASLKPQCAQESSPWTDMDRQQAQPFLTVAKPPRFRHSYPAYANMGDSALFKKTVCRPPVCEGRAEEAGRSYLYGQLTRGMAGSHQPLGNQAGRPSQHEDKTSVPSDRNQAAPFLSSGVMSQVNQAPPPSKVPDICQVLDKSTGAAIESTAPATLKHLPVAEGKGLSHPELQTAFQKQLHPKLPKDRLQPILPRASSKKMAPAKSKRDQIQCDVFSEMVTTKRLHSEMTEDRLPQCLSDSTVESPLLPTADFRPGTQLPTIKAGSATLQTVLGQPPVLQRCSVAEASPRVGSGSLYAEKPFQPLHPATFPHKYSTMRSNDVATKNRNMNSKHVTTDPPSKYERTKKKSKKTRKISFVKTFSKINDLSVHRGRTTRNINKYIPFQEMMTRENCGRDNINNHAVEDDNPVENQLPNINSRPPNSQGESQGSSDKVNTRSSGRKSTRGSVITQDSRAQDQKLEESSAISHPSSSLGQGVESRSMDSSFQDSGVMLTSTGEADESETVVISLDRIDGSDEDMNKEDSDLKEKEPEKTTKRTRKMTTKLKVKSDEVRKVSSAKGTGRARRRGKVSRTHPNLKAIKGRCPSRVERGVSVSGEDAQPHSSDTLLSTASVSHLSASSTGLHASSTHLLDSSTFSSNYQDETGEYDYDEYDEDEEDGDESGERRIMKKQSDSRRRLRKSTSPFRHISRVCLEDSNAVSSKLSTSTSITQKREQIFNWRAINFGLIAGFQMIRKPPPRLHLLPESPGRSGGGQSDREVDFLQDLSSGSQTSCLPSQSLSAADTGHAIANPRVAISHNMCTRSKELEQKVRAWKKTMTYALKSMGPERMTREGKQKHRRESLEEKDIHSYHIYTLAQQVIRKQTHNLSLRRWFKAARSVIFTFYIAKAMAQKSIEIFMRLPTFMDIGDYYRMQARASTKHFIDTTSFQLKGFKGDGFCMNPEVVNILLEDPQLRTEAEINLVLHKLQQIDSFCDFPLQAQRAMARLGFYCFLLDKRVIISQGQVPYNFYFILSGQAVASTIEERDGCVFRQTQRMLTKGQMFGEKAIIDNCLRTETVRARTNMQLLYIDRNDYVDTFMPERKMDGIPEYVKFLSSQSWMKEWPVHLLMDNAKMCYPRYFRQQQVIVANSMISEDLYVIRSGECQVVMPVDTITTTWRDVNRLLSEHFLIKDSQLVTGLYREEQMLKMQDRKLKSKARPLSASDIRETGSCSHQQLLPDQTQRLSTLLPLAVCQLQNLYHQRSISIMTSANTLCMLLELSGHGAERFHPDCFLQRNSSAKTAVPPAQEEGSSSGQHSTTLPKKAAPVSKARHGKSGSAVKKGAKKHVSVTASSGTFGQGSLSTSRNLTQSSELDGVLPKRPTCLKKERGSSAVKSGRKKSVRMSDSPSPDPHARGLSRGRRPSCWKPAPQSSWAKRRQYQMPKQCRPQVSHEASGPTRPRRGPLACVHILTLGEGDVFGFDQLDMEVCAQTKSYPAALVSCGAEVIVMKKRFFLQHANYTVQQAVHLASISVPSPEEVKNLWRIEQARDLYQRSIREQLTGPHNRC